MDYLEMFGFGLMVVGGVLSVGIILSAITDWLEKRKARKTIRRMEERYYSDMAREAVEEAEEFLRERRRP